MRTTRVLFSGSSGLRLKWLMLAAVGFLFVFPSCNMDLSNGYKKAYREMASHEKRSLKNFKKATREPRTKAQNKADKAMDRSEKEADKQRNKDLKQHRKRQSVDTKKMMKMTRRQAKKYNRDLERKKR